MEKLKDYMFLFRMELNSTTEPSEADLINMKQAWTTWIGGIAQHARLVSAHQLGLEGTILKAGIKNQTGYYQLEKQGISGNYLVKATGIEEASAMAAGCPVLDMGGTVEVRNTLTVF